MRRRPEPRDPAEQRELGEALAQFDQPLPAEDPLDAADRINARGLEPGIARNKAPLARQKLRDRGDQRHHQPQRQHRREHRERSIGQRGARREAVERGAVEAEARAGGVRKAFGQPRPQIEQRQRAGAGRGQRRQLFRAQDVALLRRIGKALGGWRKGLFARALLSHRSPPRPAARPTGRARPPARPRTVRPSPAAR